MFVHGVRRLFGVLTSTVDDRPLILTAHLRAKSRQVVKTPTSHWLTNDTNGLGRLSLVQSDWMLGPALRNIIKQ